MLGNNRLPRHVAIIMDGNGRWAQEKDLPRIDGHREGAESVRQAINFCLEKGLSALTVFAFSTENWQRPEAEVCFLLDTLLTTLEKEADTLNEKQVRLRFVGYRQAFSEALINKMQEVEKMTEANSALELTIAANYGGRWDILQAAKAMAQQAISGEISLDTMDEAHFAQYFSLQDLPPLDLLIRTGGVTRISNFLLWDAAYSELHFTKVFWPDFGPVQFQEALDDFAGRERRYGLTREQLHTEEA
jgi:undecaprenyl diphosphate synthase